MLKQVPLKKKSNVIRIMDTETKKSDLSEDSKEHISAALINTLPDRASEAS